MRGRPPVTRTRVLAYIGRVNPATVAQIARALRIDRSQVYRILHAAYGPDFRRRWRDNDEQIKKIAPAEFCHITQAKIMP